MVGFYKKGSVKLYKPSWNIHRPIRPKWHRRRPVSAVRCLPKVSRVLKQSPDSGRWQQLGGLGRRVREQDRDRYLGCCRSQGKFVEPSLLIFDFFFENCFQMTVKKLKIEHATFLFVKQRNESYDYETKQSKAQKECRMQGKWKQDRISQGRN